MDPETFEKLAAAFRDALAKREQVQREMDDARKAEVAAGQAFRAYVAQHAGVSVSMLVA